MIKKIPTTRPSISRWAVFLFLAVVVAFSAALMTGCNDHLSEAGKGAARIPHVWMDVETGCEYLAQTDGKALTPRMGRDGKQVCK